jgi:hypothetical protein
VVPPDFCRQPTSLGYQTDREFAAEDDATIDEELMKKNSPLIEA